MMWDPMANRLTLPLERWPKLVKEPLLKGDLRVAATSRVWAKIIDCFFVFSFTVAWSLFFRSALVWMPILLFPLFERIGRGQSPGKWLMGLHTVDVTQGSKVGVQAALIRNLPFVVCLILILNFSGFVELILLAPHFIWLLMEGYFIFTIDGGVRAGDILAGTRVFDYKDPHTKFVEQFLSEG
jgi:uncharacterized RDD family membrane protein YckC